MPAQGSDLPITFDEVREKNLEHLKLLNSVIFPMKFPDQLYRDCMKYPDMTHLAYHNDVLVGAVTARCENQPSGPRLYIATLGVLAPYRGYGIGRRMLAQCLAGATSDGNISEAVVHVQEGNDDAVRFYEAAGFKVRETVKDYYKRLEQPNALLLAKDLKQ